MLKILIGTDAESYIVLISKNTFSKNLKEHIKKALDGKVGVKSVSAIYLSLFPDLDVVSFIAFKQIIDCISVQKTSTHTAV